MKFTGKEPEECKKNMKCPSVLIAPDSWKGKFTSADAARHMMRAAARKMPMARIKAHLIADGGLGTLDALVCSVNGRYVKAVLEEENEHKTPLRYGVLPDETVVFESESLTKAQIQLALTLPQMRAIAGLLKAHGLDPDPVGLFDFMQAGIELREQAKFQFTRNLSDALALIGELGLPAVIGAGERFYQCWSQAERLHLDCAGRRVEVLA